MFVRPNLTKTKKQRSTIYPDVICDSVVNIDFNYLKKMGIKACFIDLDGTVVSRESYDVEKKITKVLSNAKVSIHIATNRPKSRTLKTLKDDLSATSVIHPKGVLGKPFKSYYTSALKDLNLQPHEVAMIGDRYLQDILGANRAGIYTILVHKLGKSKGKGDLYFSVIEKIFTNSIVGKYRKIK